MKAEVKLIPEEQFLDLAILYVELNKLLCVYTPAVPALYILTKNAMEKKGFIALGLYEEDKLTGFTTGYALTENTFYFSGVYVKIKNKNAKLLIEESLSLIDKLGYTSWEADCNNKQIESIVSKYGAKKMYARYKKDI